MSKLLQSVPGFIPVSKFDPELQEEEDEEEEQEDPFFLASNKPNVHFNPDDYKDDNDDSNIWAGAAVAAAKALDIMILI